VTGQWFSSGTLVTSTNKTDHHNLTEILLKMALNTINQSNHTAGNPNVNTKQFPSIIYCIVLKTRKNMIKTTKTMNIQL
jgi:hypothetical protein